MVLYGSMKNPATNSTGERYRISKTRRHAKDYETSRWALRRNKSICLCAGTGLGLYQGLSRMETPVEEMSRLRCSFGFLSSVGLELLTYTEWSPKNQTILL